MQVVSPLPRHGIGGINILGRVPLVAEHAMKFHKNLFFLLSITFALFSGQVGTASERPRMTGPDPRKEIAKGLVDELASHFNARDYVQFMDGFTDRHAGRIRERVKVTFLADDLRMDVDEVVLFSGDEESMEFGIRYATSVDGSINLITSVVTARLDGSAWKIDSEKVKKTSRRGGADSTLADSPKPRNRQIGGVAFEPAGPGRAIQNNRVPANWDPMNPDPNLIDPNLRDMIGSGIGILPGSGCANGRCGL